MIIGDFKIFIECMADSNTLLQVSDYADRVLKESGFKGEIIKTLIEDSISVYLNNGVPTVLGKFVQRNSHIRLIVSNNGSDSENIKDLILIGADDRVDNTWQNSAFLFSVDYKSIKNAFYRLVLDPLFTGSISFNFTMMEPNSVQNQIFKSNILFSLANLKKSNGRILWVDANPHVDTILDSYGLSILNKISRQNGFFGMVISPYNEFANPEIDIREVITLFKPDLIGVSLRNIDDVITIRNIIGNEKEIDTNDYLTTVNVLVKSIIEIFKGPLIIGGAALTRAPQKIMAALDIKYGISGPGEVAINQLLQKWLPYKIPKNERLAKFTSVWKTINGCIFIEKKKGKIKYNQLFINEPMSLSNVPRDPFKLWQESRLRIPTAVKGTYGCPLNCSYCLEATPGRHIKQGAAVDIVNEMLWLMDEYNIRDFHLTDSEANLPFSRLRLLALAIIDRNMGNKITWTVYSTPWPFDLNSISLLVESGLKSIKLSIDHFVDDQLLNLGRTHKEKNIHDLLEALISAQLQIDVSGSILFGAPGETLESIGYAISQIEKYSKQGVTFYYNTGLRVYQGTPLYDNWKNGYFKKMFYGPGLIDDAQSPLVFCSPESPRILAKKIDDVLLKNPYVRGIDSGRSIESNQILRLINVALSRWFKGDILSAENIIRDLHLPRNSNSDLLEHLILCEQQIRSGIALH